MIIEIKVQNDSKTLWDSVVLTKEMLLELIDHNPDKLKSLVRKLSRKHTVVSQPEKKIDSFRVRTLHEKP